MKRKLLFGFILLITLAVQIIAAYFSILALLAGFWAKGIAFFLVVPALGYILAYIYIAMRKRPSTETPLDRR